jgi:hypothetical protein
MAHTKLEMQPSCSDFIAIGSLLCPGQAKKACGTPQAFSMKSIS